jgi:hypothetical protein
VNRETKTAAQQVKLGGRYEKLAITLLDPLPAM